MHLTQVLFFLNTAIWLVLGIVSLERFFNQSTSGILTTWIVALLMFGNAAAMLISGVVVARGGKWSYFFVLAVLLVNILLTFTDQVGILDLLTLLIDLVLLILVIITYKTRDAQAIK